LALEAVPTDRRHRLIAAVACVHDDPASAVARLPLYTRRGAIKRVVARDVDDVPRRA